MGRQGQPLPQHYWLSFCWLTLYSTLRCPLAQATYEYKRDQHCPSGCVSLMSFVKIAPRYVFKHIILVLPGV